MSWVIAGLAVVVVVAVIIAGVRQLGSFMIGDSDEETDHDDEVGFEEADLDDEGDYDYEGRNRASP
jgi:hypothetical protein